MKRLMLIAAFLAATVAHALGAGTLPGLSGAIQLDSQGKILSGCKLYLTDGGTSTPRTAYSDSGLVFPTTNPIECDASGRLPHFYVSDTPAVKARLTNSAGVTLLTVDNILVIGPSGGGGGGTSVDATTVFTTGDVKCRSGAGAISGWVRMNGRTIGSATSGASERAHADAQSLFEFLWTADANLTVSGGRGASANADWSANKTIALPDARGRVLASLDDHGNSAAGRLTTTYFGAAGTTLHATGGAESRTLVTGNLPPYTPAGTVGITDPGHTHTYGSSVISVQGPFSNINQVNNAATNNTTDSSTTGITASFTGTAQGGTSTAFAIVPPTLVVGCYLKL